MQSRLLEPQSCHPFSSRPSQYFFVFRSSGDGSFWLWVVYRIAPRECLSLIIFSCSREKCERLAKCPWRCFFEDKKSDGIAYELQRETGWMAKCREYRARLVHSHLLLASFIEQNLCFAYYILLYTFPIQLNHAPAANVWNWLRYGAKMSFILCSGWYSSHVGYHDCNEHLLRLTPDWFSIIACNQRLFECGIEFVSSPGIHFRSKLRQHTREALQLVSLFIYRLFTNKLAQCFPS